MIFCDQGRGDIAKTVGLPVLAHLQVKGRALDCGRGTRDSFVDVLKWVCDIECDNLTSD